MKLLKLKKFNQTSRESGLVKSIFKEDKIATKKPKTLTVAEHMRASYNRRKEQGLKGRRVWAAERDWPKIRALEKRLKEKYLKEVEK
jgi:hypothetical protein